jgi:peptidoglycan/LPS O-acetylase OafA/YrhL
LIINDKPHSVDQGFRIGYLPSLNGLRGFAVLAVMVYHAGSTYYRGGFIGVDVFFVLSGFLITALLIQELDQFQSISLKAFYARRALRLLPALIILLVAYTIGCFFVVGLVLKQNPLDLAADALIVLFYASNWTLASGLDRPLLLGHAWSLSIEEQFYAFWPLLLVLLLKIAPSRRWLPPVTFVLAIAFFANRLYLLSTGASLWRLYFGLDTRLDSLLMGCTLGLIIAFNAVPSRAWIPRVSGYMATAAAISLVAISFIADWYSVQTLRIWLPLTVVSTTIIVFHLVTLKQTALHRVLETPIIVWIGKISYGLYLWHFPVFGVLKDLHVPGPLVLLLGSGITFAVASLSYYGVERRFLNMKAGFARRHSVRPKHETAPRLNALTAELE